MPLYTAVLSTAEFGTADVLTQTANLLIPVAALGICDGLFRFAIDCREEERANVFSGAVGIILLGMIPLAAIIQLLRFFNIYDGYVWLVFFYICSANLHSVCANYLRALDKTRAFAIQGIANTVLTVTLNVIFLVVCDMGVMGYVLSVAVSDMVITVALVLICKLYRDIRFTRPDKKLIGSMLKFSIPYIPTTMMWMITSSSDRFIVTAYEGAAVNGLYAAAYKLPTLITLAGTVFIEAWQLSSVKDASEEDRADFFEEVYKNYISIMFMGTSLLVVMSKVLTVLLLDDMYYSSWQYVPVLGIAMIFSAFSSFLGSVYFLRKKSVRSLLTMALGAGLNVVLNFALIPFWGAMGAAIATVISYMAVFIFRAYDTAKYVRFGLCIPKLIINSILLIAQTVIMVLEIPYWIYWQIGILVFIVIFNGREIIKAIFELSKKILKNKK